MFRIYPVILSGGSGTRLWPISRLLYPKQFLNLTNKNSFFQETALRFHGRAEYGKPIIVCNAEHRFIVKEQLSEIEVKADSIILEDKGRNTAAAAAIAALKVTELDPEGLVLLLASDHLISKPEILRDAIMAGKEAAINEKLVVFGIQPDKPETGYGYIKMGQPLQNNPNCFTVEQFVEKPNKKTAESYISSGKFLWNSSLFLFKPATYLKELKQLNPNIALASTKAFSQATRDLDFTRLNEESFAESPSISIDYAVMEKTKNAAVVPVNPGWSDIGSWSTLWDTLERDQHNNAFIGDVTAVDTANTLIHSSSRLVTAIGLENIIVADTPDALLILNKDKSQSVKTIVDALQSENRPETVQHKLVHRPWGNFETLNSGPSYQVKRITVNSGATLSLQSHEKRSEHWVVIKGVATVTLGGSRETLDIIDLYPNQSTYIPIGFLHRLENKRDEPLIIIEVQTGDYIDESDIKRYEDVYGRVSPLS